MTMMKKLAAVAAVMAMGTQFALAEDASCKTVRFADVGWSDIAATTGAVLDHALL